MQSRNLKIALGAALMASFGFVASAAAAPAATPTRYVAHFTAMNSATTGSTASGEATLEVKGHTLAVTINMEGVPAETVHWQHFHGFTDGHAATCPTASADANHDGIVDLIETEPVSGTTMVPFDAAPAAMDVAHGTYPKADAAGSYSYTQSIPLLKLEAAFGKAFKGQKLDLAHRVIYIHGVPDATKLPSTVASLGPIPASVTLPIACGVIEAAK